MKSAYNKIFVTIVSKKSNNKKFNKKELSTPNIKQTFPEKSNAYFYFL